MNAYLANAALNRGRAGDRADLVGSWLTEGDAQAVFDYTLLAGLMWIVLGSVLGVVSVVLTPLLSRAMGDTGRDAGIDILIFSEAFCMTGTLDNLWRNALAQIARSRHRDPDVQIDAPTQRLLSAARFNDCTPLLQLAVAAVVTWQLS